MDDERRRLADLLMGGNAAQQAVPMAPGFPDAPPSRMDAAYQTSLNRWRAIADNPAALAELLASPSLGATAVLSARANADPALPSQRGMLPLGGPRADSDRLPVGVTATEGTLPQAAQVDTLSALLLQKSELQKQIATAAVERDKQSKSGQGPKWQDAVKSVNALTESMTEIDNQIKDETGRRKKAAFANDPKTIEAERVREQMLSERKLPFHERAPDWVQNIMPWAPGLAGAATTALVDVPLTIASVLSRRADAKKLREALDVGLTTKSPVQMSKAAERSANLSQSFERGKGFNWPYLGYGPALSGVEGAVLASTPELMNSRLPMINQERQAYEEYVKRLPADHPERPRIEAMIAQMPANNPVQSMAAQYMGLSPEMGVRSATGAGQGILGSLLAHETIGAFGKAFQPNVNPLQADAAAVARRQAEFEARAAERASRASEPKPQPRKRGRR